MNSLINEVIHNYLIKEEIGTGGMGTVYKGSHLTLERTVAIKVINPNLLSNPALINRFYKEAKIHALLQHINIVTVYDFFDYKDNCFLVMEYINGDSIENIIKEKGAFDIVTALSIFKQMLTGLSYAHSKGVIHKDIKASNFLLTPSVVKITDFGISQLVTDSSATSTLYGTPKYMSPEQVLGKKLDYRSDVYSLSVTFYEMITGNPPFVSGLESDYEIKKGHVEIKPPKPSIYNDSIPEDLEDIILKGLSKNPKMRHQSADEYLRDIDKFIENNKSKKINTIDLYEGKHLKNINFENVDFNIKGEFKNMPYHKLLVYLYKNKETGFLFIDSEIKLQIYFQYGNIANVTGIIEDLSLGELLVRRSRITKEDQLQAVNFSLETGLKIGEALITMNKISPHELSSILEDQIKEKLIRGFHFRDGFYAFKKLDELRLDITYNINPIQLIYDYVMSFPNKDIDEDLWNYRMNAKYKLNKDIETELKKLVFSSSKQIKIIDYLKLGNRLIDLVLNIPVERELKFSFLHFLIISELIEITENNVRNIVKQDENKKIHSKIKKNNDLNIDIDAIEADNLKLDSEKPEINQDKIMDNNDEVVTDKTLVLEDEIEFVNDTLVLDDDMQISSETTRKITKKELEELRKQFKKK